MAQGTYWYFEDARYNRNAMGFKRWIKRMAARIRRRESQREIQEQKDG